MPIPFLLGAVALGAGILGIGGHMCASDKREEAERINQKARKLANSVQSKIDYQKSETQRDIANLGKTKIEILAGSINNFVSTYSQIKNVDLSDSVGLDELKNFNPNSQEFLNMQEASFNALEIMKGGIAGVASGALAAAGVYGTVGLLGSASTGTAIASLGGAAATNATLSWLGGGTLASGSLGVAGGTAVLGGAVLGIGLLVSAFVMDNKAEEAVADAKTNLHRAMEFEEQGENTCSLMRAISWRGQQINDLLCTLDRYLQESTDIMKNVIVSNSGKDWNSYVIEEKKLIGLAVQLAQTMKIILDTPLLREDGSLSNESGRILESSQEKIDSLVKDDAISAQRIVAAQAQAKLNAGIVIASQAQQTTPNNGRMNRRSRQAFGRQPRRRL